MSAIPIIIPSRLSATRLPQKPLADIGGIPMVIRVMTQALLADIGPVIVACCSEDIKDLVEKNGGTAVLTDPDLPSGTDRIFAALEIIDPHGKYDCLINLQGDLPNINSDDLRTLAKAMTGDFDIMTLAGPFTNKEDKQNPNIVKIAMAKVENGEKTKAYYFSRSPIPSEAETAYHHIGVYGYHRKALEKFVALPPSYLEKAERLEQLRALEAKMTIEVVVVENIPLSIDTPEDLEKARRLLSPQTA